MNSNKKEIDVNIELNSYNRGSEEIRTATANVKSKNNYQSPQNNRFSNLANNRELANSKRLNEHDKTGPRYSNQGSGLSPNQDLSDNQEIENSNNLENTGDQISRGINNGNGSNNNLNAIKGLNNGGNPTNFKGTNGKNNPNNLGKTSPDNLNRNNKGTNSFNKIAGQSAKQKLANKLIENNPKARMAKEILSKKQSFGSKNAGSSFFKSSSLASSTAVGSSLLDNKDKLDDMGQSQGLTGIKVSKKAVLAVAAVLAPTFAVVVFLVLIVAATQTYLTANKLGQADSVSDDSAQQNIDKIFGNEEKLSEEIDDVSYIFDIYVNESSSKLGQYEFAAKKENEIDPEADEESAISQLKEFYPDIVKYDSENYDKNIVYRFFTKLYNIYHYYAGKGVKLDVPLLMSVLNLQSTDAEVVFEQNTKGYDKSAIEQGTNNPDFDVNKDWSSYKSTLNNSSHDMEVLAQAMVKEGSSGSSDSKDGDYVDGIEFMTGGIGDIYYFNQLDYASEPYSYYGTIASHGCGPTSLAIVVSSLLKEVHDPVELTDKVCSIGGCFNEGSSWDSITNTPPLYGLQVSRTTNTQEVISSLGTGKSLVIAIMCPGHFTSGGHFIVLTGTNSNGEVTVADPASRDRSTNWDFNIVAEENCGAYWIVNK